MSSGAREEGLNHRGTETLRGRDSGLCQRGASSFGFLRGLRPRGKALLLRGGRATRSLRASVSMWFKATNSSGTGESERSTPCPARIPARGGRRDRIADDGKTTRHSTLRKPGQVFGSPVRFEEFTHDQNGADRTRPGTRFGAPHVSNGGSVSEARSRETAVSPPPYPPLPRQARDEVRGGGGGRPACPAHRNERWSPCPAGRGAELPLDDRGLRRGRRSGGAAALFLFTISNSAGPARLARGWI
jgi:hypothetical protein